MRNYTLEDLKKELFKNEKVKKDYSRELTKIRIAQQIYELRKQNHISQQELAKRLHTSQQAVARLEKDDYRPTTKTLERLAEIFHKTNEAMKEKNLFGEVFTFIDASSIVTKTALWDERDKAIADGEEKLKNAIINNYTADKDAKWGAKSKTNIWFGYKRHNAVDMRFGLITQVAVTPANTPDYKAVKDITPKQGMVFMDKGYDYKEADEWIREKNCVPATLRKNNNKQKNFDLDSWRSKVRMPFESTFSKQRKRAKYRGQTNVTFQCLAEAMVYNLKKAIRILPSLTTVET